MTETPDVFSAPFWDERYGSDDRVWSGNPNPHLVTLVSPLTPGRALEVGCGEGADALWLAEHGWRVTGLDVSQVALGKAAAEAERRGLAARCAWEQADLTAWAGPITTYDLVTAHFMHLLPEATKRLHPQLAAAVAPGGTLLVVGHHPMDERPDHQEFPDVRFTAEQAAESLDPAEWTDVQTLTLSHDRTHDGTTTTWHDAVLLATR